MSKFIEEMRGARDLPRHKRLGEVERLVKLARGEDGDPKRFADALAAFLLSCDLDDKVRLSDAILGEEATNGAGLRRALKLWNHMYPSTWVEGHEPAYNNVVCPECGCADMNKIAVKFAVETHAIVVPPDRLQTWQRDEEELWAEADETFAYRAINCDCWECGHSWATECDVNRI